MAEQTDRLLNDVVIELKTTNRLIEQGNKDPSLPSSIKQNAGEIGNAILLAGRSERFQKQEGVTKVDEGVEKLQQSNQTLLQDILGVVSDIQTGQQAPSILKSKEKRDAAQANRLNMSLKDLGKKFKDFGGKIRDTFTKGIGGKLAFLSLLLLIPKILNSETFIKVLRYLDKEFIPRIRKINDFLKRNITDPLDKLTKGTSFEGLGSTLANVALIGGGLLLLLKPIKTITFLFKALVFPIKLLLASLFGTRGGIQNRLKRFNKRLGESGKKLKSLTSGVSGKRVRVAARRAPIVRAARGAFLGGGKLISGALNLGIGAPGAIARGVGAAPGAIAKGVGGAAKGIVGGVKSAAGFVSGGGLGLKGLGGGVAKLAPNLLRFGRFLGPIATAGIAIFDGVKSGLEEAGKETATKGSIIREGISGALSGLTFGLISQEGISGALQSAGDKLGDLGKSASEKIGSAFKSIKEFDYKGLAQDVGKSVMNFGMNLKEKALALIPSKEQVKDFGKKVGGFVKGLFKDKNEQETVDAAVENALAKHFEIEHQRADKMNENALNKMEGGQTTVVNQTTVDASNNSKMESVQHNMKQISHTDPTQLAVANAQ